jgi:hypothetical protein
MSAVTASEARPGSALAASKLAGLTHYGLLKLAALGLVRVYHSPGCTPKYDLGDAERYAAEQRAKIAQ